MAKYRDNFKLDEADIQLIEDALRNHKAMKTFSVATDCQDGPQIHEIQSLLGKLHNQKIFYSTAHRTSQPIG